MPGIAEVSQNWEGRTVDGFLLSHPLGGSENTRVYLTSFETRRAAIKLLLADGDQADAQLKRWTAASRLSHLNLIRIFATGRSQIDNVSVVYLVMECGEEDLSQVIPGRALTPVETREMLDPALTALDYLHRQGFVHAHLKPSNIMAVDDRLKLSTDHLFRTGEPATGARGTYDPPDKVLSPATDVWSLATILVKALGPPTPEPFKEIALHCLPQNPADRWTIPQIVDHLSHPGGTPASPRRKRFPVPVGVMVLLGVVIIVVAGVMLKRPESATPAPTPAPVVTQQAPPPEPVAAAPEKPVKKKAEKTKKTTTAAAASAPQPVARTAQGDQPMPQIIPSATRSIRGKVIVTVKAEVDASGAVTSATAAATSSRYFAKQSAAAVRQWKLQPGTWQIRFEFLPGDTKVSQTRISP